MSSQMNWVEFIQNGLNSGIDGYIAIETEKAKNEQVPPTPPQQPITPKTDMQNVVIFGKPVNRNVLAITGLALVGLMVYKVAS